VEIATVLEDTRVEQLVFELMPRALPVGVHEIAVRERPLWILVEVLHVRVRGRRVEVEVVLLDVLAVIALAIGEPEHALFQDRVAFVPQRKSEAQTLRVVRDASEAILAPAIGPRSRLVVAEVVPGVTVLAVVFSNRAPLPLAEVGSPLLPGNACFTG